MKTPATMLALKQLADRLGSVSVNAGRCISDSEQDRLIGLQQGIDFALGRRNHVDTWMKRWDSEVRSWHKITRPGCDCGVCRSEVPQ
jgi:hypothetical protein